MSEEVNLSESPGATAQPQAKTEAPQGVEIDESRVSSLYANFARVSYTPEELILDLGLNTQPMARDTDHKIVLSQRVILNHYTAKRLLAALGTAVQRHEQVFGVLETDIRKRVKT